MKRRRGIYLPIAAVVITMLLVLAASRIILSRRHLSTVARLANNEKAYHLAASACLIGQELLAESVRLVNEGSQLGAPQELRPILQALQNQDKVLLQEALIPLEPPQIEYLRSMCSPDSLELTIVFGPVVPLYKESGSSSLTSSPREATVTISIIASATIDKSKRTVRAFTQGRLINITPPVIGKFVLFTRSFGNRNLNSLRDAKSSDLLTELPLVFHAGATDVPADKKQKVDFLNKQGWCFLGGADEWSFNLSLGGGLASAEEGVLQRGISTTDLPTDSILKDKGSFSFYRCDSPLHEGLGGDETRQAYSLLPAESYSKTSLMNLWGTVSRTTPTIIIGSVYRRFAKIKGLLNENTGVRAPFPYLDSSTFDSNNWPGGVSAGTISILRQTFHDDFAEYEQRMSKVHKEPYNKGFDYIDDQELEPVSSLEVDGFPAMANDLVVGNAYSLKDDKDVILFRRANFDNLRDFTFLKQKASFIYSTGQELLNIHQKSNGELSLGGAVLVNGDIAFTKSTTVKRGEGGLILATGDITVRANILAPTKEPLSLVSLGGKIIVKQCKQVQCALIALDGEIELKSAVAIEGLLAGGKLVLAETTTKQERSVTYNQRFDPTNSESVEKNWRLKIQKEWQTLVH